ncbi:MAG TPA: hypothetical protein VES79_06440 [Solirubrobacteraceae bacterium]|nr:hypothetical protein [Solirubrobacteraceae bacterium]
MGLLDDAIREHLELKRRRGADPHDVERQEQEALGPPIRGEFASSPAAPEAAEGVEPVEPPAPIVAPDPDLEPVPEPRPGPEPRGDLEGWLDEPAEAPRHSTTEYVPDDVEAPRQATTEYVPDDVEAPPEEPNGEDVLEETPEFLQETPEHERLWFEQKPPRDFDLDR